MACLLGSCGVAPTFSSAYALRFPYSLLSNPLPAAAQHLYELPINVT